MKQERSTARILGGCLALAALAGLLPAAVCAAEAQYRVLSPWAEVDPIPQRGIAERLDSLDGKTIGLFANYKRASVPIVEAVGRRLKERYPNIKVSLYHSRAPNVIEAETENKPAYEAWLKGVDAVVTAVGD